MDRGGNWQLHILGSTKTNGTELSVRFSASNEGIGASLQTGQWTMVYLMPSSPLQECPACIHEIFINRCLQETHYQLQQLLLHFDNLHLLFSSQFFLWGERVHSQRFQSAQRLGVDKSSISTSFEWKHLLQPLLAGATVKAKGHQKNEGHWKTFCVSVNCFRHSFIQGLFSGNSRKQNVSF